MMTNWAPQIEIPRHFQRQRVPFAVPFNREKLDGGVHVQVGHVCTKTVNLAFTMNAK